MNTTRKSVFSGMRPSGRLHKFFNPDGLDAVLREGARRAQAIARETLGEVREKMGILEAAL